VADGVTILGGSGALGFGLAVRLGAAGMPVTIGSRDAGRAADAAERARSTVAAGTFAAARNAEAAAASDVVFLCVPFRNQAETLDDLRPALQAGQILVDATVPLATAAGGKATRTVGVWQGSAAEQAQELVPAGVAVVSALHTVSAATLADLDHALSEDVLVTGRRRDDKRRVAQVIERVDGLRCVDAGGLEQARIVEPLTAMLIGINRRYRTHAGIRITGLPDGDRFPPSRPRPQADSSSS
jgi:NADPH-dependent F420 reductase